MQDEQGAQIGRSTGRAKEGNVEDDENVIISARTPIEIIAPGNLLQLGQGGGSSSSMLHQPSLNPRYFQAYTDRVRSVKARNEEKEKTKGYPVPEDVYDGGRGRLKDFVENTVRRGEEEGVERLSLLSVRTSRLRDQDLYRELLEGEKTKEVLMEEVIHEFQDPDLASLRIQCWYRGILGKRRHKEQYEEHQRRERAAIRVQCAWRGRMGYAKFLRKRAQTYEEKDGAVRIQGLWRGKSSRQVYNSKKKDIKSRNDSARRIQSIYRGRQARLDTLRKKRERGSVLASTTAWGETENGVGLLVDIASLNGKSKFGFSSIMSLPAKSEVAAIGVVPRTAITTNDPGLKFMPLRFSRSSFANGFDEEERIDEDENDDNERLLEEMKGESSGMVKALARIEAMTEELEEDFAKTNQQLIDMATVCEEGLKDRTNLTIASRLSALEFENEVQRNKERDRLKRRGGSGKENNVLLERRRRAEVERNEKLNSLAVATASMTEKQCEDDLKECWGLIEQLQTQLY